MTPWDPTKHGGYKDEDDLRAAFERRAKRRLDSTDDPEIVAAAEAAAERRRKAAIAPPAVDQVVTIRSCDYKVLSVDDDGGFYARSTPDDGSDPSDHYWPAGTDWTRTPTPLESSLASVFAGVNPAQGAAVTESVAAFNSNPGADLVGAYLLPGGEGAEFGGFPPDAAIVEFTYRDRDPVAADREEPGREVTVFGVHGEILDTHDFG